MDDTTTTVAQLKAIVKQFTHEREWQRYHDPKNLSMLISTEAAELMDILRWTSTQDAYARLDEKRTEIEYEIADIAYALFDFCNSTNIDIAQALTKKMVLNAQKYPIAKSKGNNKKYNELQ